MSCSRLSLPGRVTREVSECSAVLQARTTQLARLHQTSEILRQVIRFLYLTRKLKGHLHGGTRELGKAAQAVVELEAMRAEGGLAGVEVIDAETRWIVRAGEEVSQQATRMLQDALETQVPARARTHSHTHTRLAAVAGRLLRPP